MILQNKRRLFDIPDDIAYFNCSYNSPLLRESARRLHEGVDTKSSPWNRSAKSFFEDAETVRLLCSQLFGGGSDDYAVVPSTSYAMSAAARAVEPSLRPEDKILILEKEFPSQVLPWKRTALETGAKIITLPEPEDGDWTKVILENLDPGVRIAAISSCHWTNGARVDLLAVSKECRKNNIILAVDATQSLGAIPFSVDEIQPDFMAASGYKWLLSPYGFSIFYVAPKWQNARPLEEAWLARENAEDFSSLVRYSDVYLPGARRFDAGEKCTPTILPGAIAALEQIKEWGVQNIADTLEKWNDQMEVSLRRLGFVLPEKSKRLPHLLGAKIPSNLNLIEKCREKNIYISQRGDSLRIAPHLHITENDVNRLIATLESLIVDKR